MRVERSNLTRTGLLPRKCIHECQPVGNVDHHFGARHHPSIPLHWSTLNEAFLSGFSPLPCLCPACLRSKEVNFTPTLRRRTSYSVARRGLSRRARQQSQRRTLPQFANRESIRNSQIGERGRKVVKYVFTSPYAQYGVIVQQMCSILNSFTRRGRVAYQLLIQGWSRYASRMLCRGSCPAPIPSVEIDPIDERIRNLCTKAASARGREVERVFSEMRAALREHAQFVRDRRHNPQSLAKRRLTLPRAASLPSKGCRLTGRSATSVRFMSLR